MHDFLTISIQSHVASEHLGGAVQGEVLLSKILPRIPRGRNGCFIVLDFKGICLATTSYLRASVMSLRTLCAAESPPIAVVVANASFEVREELEILLTQESDALIAVDMRAGKMQHPRVLGRLDPKQEEAFRAVLQNPNSDAPKLALLYEDLESSRSTKWNNRLVALARKGLVVETIKGRSKTYGPVVEGMKYGA